MDLAFFIRNRLRQLWLSSRDRARASSQAESYIASLQTASNRTDLHDQLERVLQLPQGHLARLADLQRREHRLKKPLERSDAETRRVALRTGAELPAVPRKVDTQPSRLTGEA